MATTEPRTASPPARPTRTRYAVELPGRLSPSLLCSLTRDVTRDSEVRSLVESVFVLPEADLSEVAARLHDHGLVVLGIRKLTTAQHRDRHPTGEEQP
ncbi:hypothetical protein [Nocardioides taihuensis]|uniref:Uncharacterized protein n=1 Tax=Nocardioides taihuensis TaxID=1835606 RepID=A0ABW0BII2_9ACTN